MQLLKDRILKDGIVKPGNILKVDSFLNHQMDITLINEIGKEFKRRFSQIVRLLKSSLLRHPASVLPVLPHSILMYLSFLPKKPRV